MPAVILVSNTPTKLTAYRHDGTTFATNGDAFRPSLWTANVRNIAADPSGDLVAVFTTSPNALDIYETRGLSRVTTLTLTSTAAPATSYRACFSPDGARLAIIYAASPYIQIFNTADWTEFDPPDVALSVAGFGNDGQMAWSADSRYLAISVLESEAVLTVYDTDTSTPTRVTTKTAAATHQGVGVAWSPDGARLLFGGGSTLDKPAMYETAGWTEVPIPAAYPSTHLPLAIFWHGDYIAINGIISGDASFLFVYDTTGSNDAAAWALTDHTLDIGESVEFMSMGHGAGGGAPTLAYITSDRVTYIASPPDQARGSHEESAALSFSGFLYGLEVQDYPAQTIGAKRVFAAAGTATGYVKLYDASWVEQALTLTPGLPDEAYTVDLSADGTRLAVGCSNFSTNFNGCYLYEFSTPASANNRLATLFTEATGGEYIAYVRFSPDGTKLAVSLDQGDGIRVFDVATFAQYTQPVAPPHPTGTNYPGRLAWSPDSRYVSFCTHPDDDGASIRRVYDTNTTTLTLVPAASEDGEASAWGGGGAFSPDGSRYLSGLKTASGAIKLFETTGWTTVALPSDLPPDANYDVSWAGNYIFLGDENDDLPSYVYDTGGSPDPSGWILTRTPSAGYAWAVRVSEAAPQSGTIIKGASRLLLDPPNQHPAFAAKAATTDIFDAVIQSLEEPPGGDTVAAEVAEEMAASDGLDAAAVKNVRDGIGTADSPIGLAIKNILEALAVSESPIARSVRLLIERMGLSDALAQQAVLHGAVTEAVNAIDRLRVILRATLAELLDLGESWIGSFTRIAQVLESMMATDGFSSRMDARAALALVMTLGDRVFFLTAAEIEEILEEGEDVTSRMVANLALIEMADMTMSALAGRVALVGILEGLALGEGLDPVAQMHALLAEGIDVDVELILFGDVYQGWVVNNDTLAPSEYDNFPFNSMARIGQRYFGASETGLFEFGGDDDAGDPIMARILTGESDFGAPQMKRVERAYMGYSTRGELVLKVIAMLDGQKTEFWYRARPLRAGEVTETRVPIGRGIESRYWQFEWVNVDGADFELDRLDLQVLITSRRI